MANGTAIRSPTDDLGNHTIVLRQLKEIAEVGQRLRGDPTQSFVRISELVSAGIVRFVNNTVQPPAASTGTVNVADSITGTGSSGNPLQLSGDSASPGNTMLYGTNSSGTKGWYAQPSGGSSTLAGLSDVLISSPTNNQVLTYNSSASKWENQTPSSGSGLTLIGKSTAASSVASLSVTGIPSTYSALQIVVSGRSTASAGSEDMLVQFNGDTGSNYSNQLTQSFAGTVQGVEVLTTTAAHIGSFTAATAPGNRAGVTTAFIPNYASTTFDKAGTGSSMVPYNTGSSGNFLQIWGFVWFPSTPAAISSISIAAASGNLVAGSYIAVYGLA